jgi:hypothetical protein
LGHLQHTLCQLGSTSGRRLGWRMCLRRGCHKVYRARRWNQRYCPDPTCRKLVRRWQAAKRQQQRREQPEVRQAHAAAERERRARRATSARRVVPAPDADSSGDQKPEQKQCAWSRSRKQFPTPFCDRPGCYDAVRPSCRCRARYCGDGCRQAIQRVRDRERKWLTRQRSAGGGSSGQEPPDRQARPHTGGPMQPRFP